MFAVTPKVAVEVVFCFCFFFAKGTQVVNVEKVVNSWRGIHRKTANTAIYSLDGSYKLLSYFVAEILLTEVIFLTPYFKFLVSHFQWQV